MQELARGKYFSKVISIALALALALGVLAPTDKAFANVEQRVVSGLVLDTSGNRIPYARIVASDGLNQRTIDSNQLGYYEVFLPNPRINSVITLSLTKRSLYTGGVSFTSVYSGIPTEHNFSITPVDTGTSSISGTVTRDGIPLTNHRVQLWCHSQSRSYDYVSVSDTSGVYRFAGLPSSWCNVQSQHNLQGLSRYADLQLNGSPVTVNLDSSTVSTTTVRGVIGLQTSGTAQRLSTDIHFRYDDGQSRGWFWGRSNQNGEYSISNVPVGTLFANVKAPTGYFGVSNSETTISSGAENTINFTLNPLASGDGVFSGRLLDSVSGAVSGATVRISAYIRSQMVEFLSASDANGSFRFSNLPAGTYRLEATSQSHFDIDRHDFRVPISGSVSRDLVMLKRGNLSIQGSVTAGAERTDGMTVYLSVGKSPNQSRTFSTTVSTDGTYRFDGLGAHFHSISVYDEVPQFFTPYGQEVTLSSASPTVTNRDLIFSPYPKGNSSFEFRVRDTSSSSLSNARIELRGSRLDSRSQTRTYVSSTSTLGVARFENLPAGTYSAYVSASSKLSVYRSLFLGTTRSEIVSVTLRNSGTNTVAVTVQDKITAAKIPQAWVSMSFSNQSLASWGSGSRTNSSGVATISQVPDGTHNLWVNPPEQSEYKNYHQSSVLIANSGSTQQLTVQLEKYPTGTGKIFGIVTTEAGSPISGVRVSVWSEKQNKHISVDTNDSGEYELPGLVDDRHYVNFNRDGYLPRSASISISGGEQVAEDVELTPVGTATVSGVIKDDSDVGVAGARVHAYFHENGSSWSQAVDTDFDGSYRFENVPTGRINLSVSTENLPFFDSHQLPIDVERAGEDITEDVVLERYPTGTGSLQGTVTTTNEGVTEPVPYLRIQMYCYFENQGSVSFNTNTQADGSYSFAGLADANCSIYPQAWEYLWIYKRINVFDGQVITNNIQLARHGERTLTGVVRTQSGALVEGAQVYLRYQAQDGNWGNSTRTDANGDFAMSRVPNYNSAATLELQVSPGNSTVQFFPIRRISLSSEVSRDITRDVVVEELPSGDTSISGVIRDRFTNSVISGARVTAGFFVTSRDGQQQAWKEVRATSDSLGNYSISGVPSRTAIRVTARADSYEAIGASRETGTSGSALTVGLSLTLIPVGTGSISGKVIDGSTSKAVSRVYMYLRLDGSGSIRRNAHTASSGNFKFNELPKGTYTLHVWPSYSGAPIYKYIDMSNRKITLTESTSRITNYTVTLERIPTGNSKISGQIVDERLGQGISGLSGWLYSDELQMHKNFRTNSSGNWSVDRLPQGTYSYGYSFPDETIYEIPQQRFVNVAGSNDLITLSQDVARSVPPSNAFLNVVVRDRTTHLPIPGVTVYISPDNLTGGYAEKTTTANGVVEFRNIPKTKYSVYIWTSNDYINPSQSITYDISEDTNYMSVRLERVERTGVISGVVLDDFGNPMVNMNVAATLEVLNDNGEPTGNQFSSRVTTDEDGAYSLGSVPINREVTFSVQYPDRDADFGSYAPYVERLTVTSSLVRNVVLSPAARISGQLVGQSAFNVAGMKVQVLDATTKAWRGESRVASDGSYTINKLPPGSFKVFFSDDSWQASTTRPRFGYMTSDFGDDPNQPERYFLRAEFSAGDTIQLEAGESVTLGSVPVEVGGSISGEVQVDIAGVLSNFFHRWVRIDLERRIAGSNPQRWETYTGLKEFYASGYEAGKFRVDGLPNGVYRLKFSEPWFGSTKLEDVYSAPVTISSWAHVSITSVVMRVGEPVSNPSFVELSTLSPEQREALRNQVQIPSSIATGSDILIDVGMQFAGEWVAASVTLPAPAMVSSASVGTGMISSFSRDTLISPFSSAPPSSDTNRVVWHQVTPNGTISVSGGSSPGNVKVVVQDALNRVIGWTEGRIGSTSGGSFGGGGFGGGAFGPMGPPPKDTTPRITGSFKVNFQIKVNRGDLNAIAGAKFKYQWFRCMFGTLKPNTEPIGCKPIRGATRQAYSLKNKDSEKFIVARISVSTKSDVNQVWTTSTPKIPVLKKTKR